jgi:hypothetical protein
MEIKKMNSVLVVFNDYTKKMNLSNDQLDMLILLNPEMNIIKQSEDL